MTQFAIAVGSNLGNRSGNIAAAVKRIAEDTDVIALSSMHFTKAVGGPTGQPTFMNAAFIAETDLGPHQMLHLLQRVENAMGRTREIFHGPRIIDLDLLLTDPPQIVQSGVLSIPHPRLHERAFVLDPLAQIAGHWLHPVLNATIFELRRRLAAKPALADERSGPP